MGFYLFGGSGGLGLPGVMFGLVFVLVSSIIVVVIVKGISQWSKNNQSPRLTVPATIVSKRTNISHHHSGTGNMHDHNSTTYYVTFQVESGDRMEFHVCGQEYGLLVEGDRGKVTFQGTHCLGFARTREE